MKKKIVEAILFILLAALSTAACAQCNYRESVYVPPSPYSNCGQSITPADTPYATAMGLVDTLPMLHGTILYKMRVRYFISDSAGCPTIMRAEGKKCD